jgi:1-acyl-sn-glycerol-3-phosphate acyltransferase
MCAMQRSELSRKLKVEAADRVRVVNPPPDLEGQPPPGDASPADVVELFANNRAELEREFPGAAKSLRSGGRLWVLYPVADSSVTDLSRNHGWHVLHSAGLTATDVVSLDGSWEAIRFQPSVEVPGSAIPAADMLPVGRRASPLFRLVRIVGSGLFHFMFRFDVQGRELIPDQAYVLICNHLGWMDAISLLILFAPEPRIHFLADPTSMMRNRALWALVRATGGIVPVDRAQRGSTRLFRHVERCLAEGGVVALFPEGDFGPREGDLLPFKRGFAHFAVDARVPVVPVGMAGMKELWLGKRLYVRIGEPIPADDRTVEEVHLLGEQAVSALVPRYDEPRGRKPLRRWLTGLF